MRVLLNHRRLKVGRVTPCAPRVTTAPPNGAHGVTRPTSTGVRAGLQTLRISTTPRERAVALVITLILLAVITFMAVTFLAVSRRERGSVTTATDQTTAKFAAESGNDRAVAQMLAAILANTNAFAYDLVVSTNFYNWNGYNSG